MTQRFEKAYNALYKAFMNNTLAKGYCAACAVGNILADAQGGIVRVEINKHDISVECDVDNKFWNNLFTTSGRVQSFYGEAHGIEELELLEYKERILTLTGYTWQEFARIEYAFETASKIGGHWYSNHTEEEIMEDQFNGLMAVMDVLIELDEVKEGNSYKETFKNKFAAVQ